MVVGIIPSVPTAGISNSPNCLPALYHSSNKLVLSPGQSYSRSDSQVFTSPLIIPD